MGLKNLRCMDQKSKLTSLFYVYFNQQTIDQPDLISDGYWLGDVILGNSSIPLTFTSILEECQQNSTIYNTLQLEEVIDVNELKKVRNFIQVPYLEVTGRIHSN